MTSEALEILTSAEGPSIGVKVVPGAARDRIVGLLGGMLKVAVSTAPERGKANKALIRLLAERLKIPRTSIIVDRGAQSTHKRLLIRGLQAEQIGQLLGLSVCLKSAPPSRQRGD